MSLCMIVRNQTDTWLAADSAVSREIDGKTYRVRGESREKLFSVHDGAFIFCSGLLSVSDELKRQILKAGKVNVKQIQESAKELVKALPQKLQGENYQTGIMICLPNGDIVSLVQEQDFEIIQHATPKGIQIITGGFESDAAHTLAGDALHRGVRDAVEILREVYTRLSSEIIGGDVDLYHIQKGKIGIERFSLKIKDPPHIKYIIGNEGVRA